MNGSLELYGIFSALLGIAFLVAYFFQRYRRRQWAGLAEKLSLSFETKILVAHRVFGSYRGRPILVETAVTYVGISSVLCTQVQLPTHDLHGLSLKANKRGFLGRIAAKLQTRGGMVTSHAQSQQYSIKLKPPRFAIALLGSDRPFGQLLQQREAHTLRIANNALYFVKLGVNHSEDNMLAIVNMLVDGAELCEQVVENELPP